MEIFSSFTLHPGLFAKLSPSDKAFVLFFVVLILLFFFLILAQFNSLFLVKTPVRYGKLNEGSVGAPRYKNPLYARTTAERDLASLVHAGLMTVGVDGTLVPELAASVRETEPGTFEVSLHEDAFFSDGRPVTAADVLFSAVMAEVPDEENAYYGVWDGFELDAVSDKMLRITLPPSTTTLDDALTMPILPSHVWRKIPYEEQRRYDSSGSSIGAGPYHIEEENLNFDGNPTAVILRSSGTYALGKPYIPEIRFSFFPSASAALDAFHSRELDAIHSIAPAEIRSLLRTTGEPVQLRRYATGRVFGVFFNVNDGALLEDPLLRGLLSQHINREKIVGEVLSGYAKAIDGPLATDTTIEKAAITREELERTLEDVGWRFDVATGKRVKNGTALEITLAYPDIGEIHLVTEYLASLWRSSGIAVTTRGMPAADFRERIAEEPFDAIVYGYRADTPTDLVATWRSGGAPNLTSITSFGTPILNGLLDELSLTQPPERFANDDGREWKERVYGDIRDEMKRSVPAIFLYSPEFLYGIHAAFKSDEAEAEERRIRTASDRFAGIHLWYVRKERIWKFLAKHGE